MMQGRCIATAIRPAVIPANKSACLGLKGLANHLEPGAAARFYFIEIDHEGPGAISGGAAVLLKICALRFEIVGMGFEFLTHGVSLALHRLTVRRVDAVQCEQLRFQLLDSRFVRAKVAGFACTKVIVAIGIGDGGGATILVDQFDEAFAQVRRKETRRRQQRETPGGNVAHALVPHQDIGRGGTRIRHAECFRRPRGAFKP